MNWRDTILLAFYKFDPRTQIKNPVMFLIFACASLLTAIVILEYSALKAPIFVIFITLLLWLTLYFGNMAEAIAEGKGKAQASSLKKTNTEMLAKKLKDPDDSTHYDLVDATTLRKDDVILVEANDLIPNDGQVIKGVAAMDESAITGESAAVIRESGGDRDSVIAGTKILSDWLIIRITKNPGENFLDNMIAMIEGAKRQKTPNEIALTILLCALSLIFVIVTICMVPLGRVIGGDQFYSYDTIAILAALLICLAPTTIGGLLSAIGIAGMNRLAATNIIATSGRAVEAAGDVSVLLMDKTGTITHGNRQAAQFFPASGVTIERLAEAATLASLADDTPEGKSIVTLSKTAFNYTPPEVNTLNASFIFFSADTKLSGICLENDRQILKGADDSITRHVQRLGGKMPEETQKDIHNIAREGGTPLVVADGKDILGVVYLKDTVKAGIKDRLSDLRKMGIKSVMITGDNPLTAAAIAAEAGVDDYIAQATPEAKLNFIRDMQKAGHLVAMVGDGTNDAPALAQADVALAMNSGTQAAKEAGNMIDLDSNPTKLIEVVEVGKQLLMTRGALTTFSLSNDISKYFAIMPAILVTIDPALNAFNVMHLSTPQNAILAALIFNAFSIIALVPLALKGVAYRPLNAAKLLRHHIVVYGGGGIIAPFLAIKLIDLCLSWGGL